MKQEGVFISLEGIDGAGKSSHIQAMTQFLQAKGYEVCVTREPGGTALGELLREQVLHQNMDGLTEALLIFAARRQHLNEVIRPALQRGQAVLCDRFTDATFAYQGGGRGFDEGVLSQLALWVQEGLEPSTTLWFDVPPAVAAQRLRSARAPDKFEAQNEVFFQAVAKAYARRMADAPERIVRIDAAQSQEEVERAVLSILETRV